MKRLSVLLLALSGAVIALSPMRSQAATAVSFSFFYDELAPYGNWVDVDGYGYCFQPTVASGWRPYYDGGWVYTDDGWCWNTTEPWGWATYHYGRWANVRGCGWVWVPGYEWAPAWVSWRTSSNYIGWAPLPPEARWGGGGIRFGVSFGFDIGPSYYNFCSPRYFGYSNVGRYCAPWRNNVNIIEQTTNITNITNVVNNNTTIIRSGGPNYDFVRKNSDRPIQRAQIERVSNPAGLRKGGPLKNELRGDKLRVVSPQIANSKNAKPKQVAARASSKNVDRGWGDIKDPNRSKQLRERMKNEAVAAKRPENRANEGNRPQNKKLATANRPNQSGQNKNAPKTAERDRSRVGNGLKPFLEQGAKTDKRPDVVRKPESNRPQNATGQQQRTADARRKADSDAARREEVLRRQTQNPQTAGRTPQQVQRPPTQRQLETPSRQPVQRPPQVGQRPPQQTEKRSRQPQQNVQRPPQNRPQSQPRPQQTQKKSDDQKKKESRPSQPQFRQPQTQQRMPQYQQRPSQPQQIQRAPSRPSNRPEKRN